MTQPCAPVIAGATPAPLTVRLVAGFPAAIVIPVDGTLAAPVIEWTTDSGGLPAATHSLTHTGTDDDGNHLWTVALTANQVDTLADRGAHGIKAARIVDTTPTRRVILAGRVEWHTGWSGTCTTRTPPLQVIGIPGRGITSVTDDDGDGVATITYSDGTTQDLMLPAGGPGGGGVTLAQVRAAIAEAASSGGAVHLGQGPPPDLIVGAKVDDVYIDVDTGDLYHLQTG